MQVYPPAHPAPCLSTRSPGPAPVLAPRPPRGKEAAPSHGPGNGKAPPGAPGPAPPPPARSRTELRTGPATSFHRPPRTKAAGERTGAARALGAAGAGPGARLRGGAGGRRGSLTVGWSCSRTPCADRPPLPSTALAPVGPGAPPPAPSLRGCCAPRAAPRPPPALSTAPPPPRPRHRPALAQQHTGRGGGGRHTHDTPPTGID